MFVETLIGAYTKCRRYYIKKKIIEGILKFFVIALFDSYTIWTTLVIFASGLLEASSGDAVEDPCRDCLNILTWIKSNQRSFRFFFVSRRKCFGQSGISWGNMNFPVWHWNRKTICRISSLSSHEQIEDQVNANSIFWPSP